MQYNECGHCGANNGRAGLLIGTPARGDKKYCLNCNDTDKSGNVVIHTSLNRTDEELQKTMELVK